MRYITRKLNNRQVEYEESDVHDRHARQDVRGARRSHEARHPGAPRLGPGLRDGARGTLRDESPGRVQASQGVGADGTGRARPSRAVAAGAAAGRAAARGRGLARRLPPVLGGAARPVRRIPARAPGERARPRRTRSAETREEGLDGGQDEREGAVMDDAMVREISITRIIAAPRDLVWRAWTEAEQLARWFMPHGFTVPEGEVDLRPGGKFTMTVNFPPGRRSIWHEIGRAHV